MKKVLVVGCGVSGKAVIDYLIKKEIAVVAVDKSLNKDVLCPLFEENHDFVPFDFDLVVISPGVKLDHTQVLAARSAGIEVIGEVELALRQINNPAIGVTGTNGKSTTVSLIAQVLNQSFGFIRLPMQNFAKIEDPQSEKPKAQVLKAHAVGNIGLPVISLVEAISPDEILVIELSSFQLMTMSKPSLDVAIILNITPDHIDWHGSMEAYQEAKYSIRNLLKKGGEFHSFLPNLEAAWKACEHFGLSREAFNQKVAAFKPLEHRLEYVDEIDGVKCINDSKATNIASLEHALRSIEGKVILIMGGINKGVSMAPIADLIENKARAVMLLGQSKYVIASELSKNTSSVIVETLEEAIQKGLQHAKRGDTLLLAPGCSSFDMFANYMERGEAFKRDIKKIHESKGYSTCCGSR